MIETRKSFCRFSHVFCGIEVDVENNRVVAVRGDPDNAVTEGYTCMKCRAEIERIYHPDRLISSRKRVEVTKRTVNNEIALGSQVVVKAVEWKKWQGENPFTKARFKSDRGKKPGCLTPEDVEAILAEIVHPVKRDMVAFAFYQGWRISEIRKLKWKDVDLELGRAWILDPKNGKSVEVPLSDEAKGIISRQSRRSEYVFCKLNGEEWKTNLTAVITQAALRANVTLPPRKKWHIFRRTFASTFLQNGGDLESLRVQGNWKDYSMPMWYADAADEDHRKGILNKFPKLADDRNLAEKQDSDGRNLAEKEPPCSSRSTRCLATAGRPETWATGRTPRLPRSREIVQCMDKLIFCFDSPNIIFLV